MLSLFLTNKLPVSKFCSLSLPCSRGLRYDKLGCSWGGMAHAEDSWDLGYLDDGELTADRTVVKLARGMGAPAPVLKLV